MPRTLLPRGRTPDRPGRGRSASILTTGRIFLYTTVELAKRGLILLHLTQDGRRPSIRSGELFEVVVKELRGVDRSFAGVLDNAPDVSVHRDAQGSECDCFVPQTAVVCTFV